MALGVWQATIVDDAGNVQESAQIEVRRESNGALAAIYEDRDGTTPLSNPFSAGSDGFARFYVAGGGFRIDATKGGFSRTWRHVPIGLMGEYDSVPEGLLRIDQTAAEDAANVTPVNYWKLPGDPERYGTNSTPGTTDMSDALESADAQSAAGGAPIVCRSLLHIDSKVTITGRFETPRFHCFTNTSIVAFGKGSVDAILPDWWGAVGDAAIDGTSGTNSTLAFAAAITASTADGDDVVAIHPISVGPGNFLVSNLRFPPATAFRGTGRHTTNFIVVNATTGVWFADTGNAAKIIMEGFAMYARSLAGITYGLRLGYGVTQQHGTEGYVRDIWVNDVDGAAAEWAIDIDGNVGRYNGLVVWHCVGGIRITGIANTASELVVLSPTEYGLDVNLCDVVGAEIEAPEDGCISVFINGNATFKGLVISLASGKTLSHLVEFHANATTWSIDGFTLGTAASGTTITNGNFKRADGTYFGGNATNNNRTGEGNYRSDTLGMRKQCFKLRVTNTGGTLQHRITDGGGNPSKFAGLINGASSSLTNTPTGTDSSTAMAAGGKIGSASPSVFWFDTPNQVTGYDLMAASELVCSTGDNIRPVTLLQSININGVTRTRLGVQFLDATAATAYALNTTNIGAGEFIDVKITGYLAP
jgi:hypothetical protein